MKCIDCDDVINEEFYYGVRIERVNLNNDINNGRAFNVQPTKNQPSRYAVFSSSRCASCVKRVLQRFIDKDLKDVTLKPLDRKSYEGLTRNDIEIVKKMTNVIDDCTINDVIEMINDKKHELKGLISTDGAIFIICKELGLSEEIYGKETQTHDKPSNILSTILKNVIEQENLETNDED